MRRVRRPTAVIRVARVIRVGALAVKVKAGRGAMVEVIEVAMVVTGAVAAKVFRVKAAGGRQARWTLALRVKGKHKSLF